MASGRSYYDILGVSKAATADEIRAAYRKLARKYHPDVNKSPDAAEKFSEVQEAYEVLSDETKRRAYDRAGHERYVRGGAGGAAAGSGRGQTYTWSNVGGGTGGFSEDFDFGDLSDIFSEMFGGGGGFGAGAQARSRSSRGRDIHVERLIPFETAISGGRESVRVGRGGAMQTIDVKIHKGVADGARLRVRGAGEPSASGAQPGDLILTIRVGKHPIFERHGLDVNLELPITIAEAALGATVTAPTPKGDRVELKVPPGSSSGAKLRLRGRGVETEDGVKGDLYAVIKIVAPKELSPEDRAALESMSERLDSPRTGPYWR